MLSPTKLWWQAGKSYPAPGKIVTISAFREAVLSCHVSHLGSYKVAWVRVDTQTILTIHNSIITRWNIVNVLHCN